MVESQEITEQKKVGQGLSDKAASGDKTGAADPFIRYPDLALTMDAHEIREGSAAAGRRILDDVRVLQERGVFPQALSALEELRDARVLRDEHGAPQHIVFKSIADKGEVDIDLQHETVNGRNKEQIRNAAIEQAKDFIIAAVEDPNLLPAQSKSVSQPAMAKTEALIGALLEGDGEKLRRTGQEIMNDPTLTKEVQGALLGVGYTEHLNLSTNLDGKPYLQVTNKERSQALIVPFVGAPQASWLDPWGKLDPAFAGPDLQMSLNGASEEALMHTSKSIKRMFCHLNLTDRLPSTGYKSMTNLVHAFATRSATSDEAAIEKRLKQWSQIQRRD